MPSIKMRSVFKLDPEFTQALASVPEIKVDHAAINWTPEMDFYIRSCHGKMNMAKFARMFRKKFKCGSYNSVRARAEKLMET